MFQKVALLKWARQTQTALRGSQQQIQGLVHTTTYIKTPRETSLFKIQGIPATVDQQHSKLTTRKGDSFEAPVAIGNPPRFEHEKPGELLQPSDPSQLVHRPGLVALMSKDVTAKLGKPFLGCKANRLHSNAQICALQNNFPHNSDYVIQTAVLPKYHSVAFFHRWLHTVSNASVEGQTDPWPVEIKVQKKGKVLEVAFADEQRFTFPAELLRVESPSADNRRKDQTGATRLVSGRKHVSILGVEPVGNYALRVKFDDLHENGIYTWRYLYDLGKNKYSRSKAYIKHLRERGLSREPKRR